MPFFSFCSFGCRQSLRRNCTALKKYIRRKKLELGYEGDFESVAPPWNTAEPAIPAETTRNLLHDVFGVEKLIDATNILNSLRAYKTSYEIDKLRTVNEIAAFGLKTFFEKGEPGISGYELAAEIEYAVMKQGTGYNGAKCVRGFAQVSTGPEETAIGYRPMVISTSRKLESGDLAMLELAVVANGFLGRSDTYADCR